MSENDKKLNDISEHILEIRYKPFSKILDTRGTWAEIISKKMNLDEWRVETNRIDIYDKEIYDSAFLSYKNFGYLTANPKTNNFFSDQANKFVDIVFDLPKFDKEIIIQRIGVRSKFCASYNGEFNELVKKFKLKYIDLKPEAYKAIGDRVEVLDVACPWNFKDNLGNFNTLCGPMAKKQFYEYFKDDYGFPDLGLYYDIDYWIVLNKSSSTKHMKGIIKDFSISSKNRFEKIKKLIFD